MSKRNHHLQPNFYLKGFRSDPNEKNPKVWVYEKGKPFYDGKTEQLQNPKHLTTEKAARKRDFYAFVKEDGTKDYEKYENLLRDEFEEPAKPVIEKIGRFEEIDDDEKMILSQYIASMIARGDWAKGIHIDALEKVAYSMDEVYRKTYKEQENIHKMSRIISEGKKKLTDGETFPKSIIEMADKLTEFLKKMNWRFLIAPKGMRFLTSDKPVYYTKIDEDMSEVIFPISSEITFLAFWSNSPNTNWKKLENGFWQVDSKTVEKIRDLMVRSSIKEIYFSQKTEWLVKFVNNR